MAVNCGRSSWQLGQNCNPLDFAAVGADIERHALVGFFDHVLEGRVVCLLAKQRQPGHGAVHRVVDQIHCSRTIIAQKNTDS